MKTSTFKVVTILYLTLLVSACGSVDLRESNNYLEISGNSFRKSGSTSTDILWAGVRRRSGVNTFDPRFLPVFTNEITARKVTEAFNKQTQEAAIEAALKAGIDTASIDTSVGVDAESGVTGKYHVFTLFDVFDYVDQLNSPDNQQNLERLSRNGENARVITSIAVVFDRESNRTIGASGNVDLSITNERAGNPQVSVKSSARGEVVATLSDGTIFAYEYARICWEKDDEKIVAATISVDRPGLDDDCPVGTTANALDLD